MAGEVLHTAQVTRAITTRSLHVANGTSTTMTMEAAGILGTRSIWADPLYEGPVPGGLTDAQLLEVRARYLGGPPGGDGIDPVLDLREWRAVMQRVDSYDELILWFEHDLFCQLNLIQVLTWIREHVPADKAVSLVCIGSFPGHPRFKGLGELTPDELASLVDTRQTVTDVQYSLAERAWLAFREPTPEGVERLCHADTGALPYLAAALRRFLQEFPWTSDGLSRTERRLLQLADAGEIHLHAAFPRMDDNEEVYYITDLSLASMALELSRTTPPLVTGELREPDEPDPLEGSVRLTETGRAVLRGEQDRIAICGIDRWLGGVHLQSPANAWRWDEEHQRVTKQR